MAARSRGPFGARIAELGGRFMTVTISRWYGRKRSAISGVTTTTADSRRTAVFSTRSASHEIGRRRRRGSHAFVKIDSAKNSWLS